MYYQAAYSLGGLSITDEIKATLTTRYNSEKESYEKANITLDEYIDAYGKTQVINDLLNNASNYYEVTDELLKESIGDDKIETYSYRILQVSIPTVESTTKDEEGNEITLTEEEITQKETENKQTAKTKIEEAPTQIKAEGEDFEEIAQDYGSLRLTPPIQGG